MSRSPQFSESATSLSAEHERLVDLLDNVRKVILVKEDIPAIRSALDELDEYARWEFGLEEVDFPSPEERASHHQEHAMLLEQLRDLRRSVDDGVERLQDRERADLSDCLSNWLVHALSEQTPPTKAEFSGRGFSPCA